MQLAVNWPTRMKWHENGTLMVFSVRLLIVILFVVPFALHAQQITWGEQVKLKGKARMNRILTADSTSFQTVIAQYKVVGKPEAIIDEYAVPELTQKSSITISANEDELDVIHNIGGDIYAFYSKVDNANKKHHAYAIKVGSTDEMKLDLGTISYSRGSQKGTFDFRRSQDKMKLLVIENPPYEKYSMEEFKLTMYDASLAKEWDKSIKLPYLDQDFKIVKSQVDRAGNVYLLTSHKDLATKGSDIKGLPVSTYTVLAYHKDQNRLKEFDIKLKDKWVNGLNIAFNEENDLVIGGFYSVNKDYSVSGTFFLTVDTKSLNVKNKSLNPFSDAFMDEFSRKRIDGDKKLDDFYFDHFVIGKDGSSYFTAEQYYVRTTSYYDHRTGVTNYTYYYHYNDIVVVKINKEAKVIWTKRIPKKQVTTNDKGNYSGYAVVPYLDGLKILYNDSPKNFEVEEDAKLRPMNNPQKSMATIIQISADGKVSRKPLFSAQEYQTILQPRIGKMLENKSLLIYTQKGKTFRFATINFDQ